MLSPHGSFSEHAVHGGITTTDLQRDPDLPASHQTQEGSQHEAPVNATQQSSVSAMQTQRGESGGTLSQTANPRKRRNPVEKTHGDERLQPPHKKLKQNRTIAREENTSILRSTELSPTIRLSGGNGLRRYQPHREVKILPTIEHPVDPGHRCHSAYPQDIPLRQDLNKDNVLQHCSQVDDARHVSYNAPPPGSNDPYEPNKSSNPDLYSRGGFFRGPEQKSREVDHDGSTQVNKYPEKAAYPDAEMTSRARVKREPAATMKSTSRRSVSCQPPYRDDSLLAGSRLDFGLAEGSAVARLRRELAEIRTTLDSICSQTNPQMDPQGQARRKEAARSEKANNIMSDHPPKPGAAMTDASAPANTSTSVIDHRLSKGTANHGSVGLIARGSQHNGEKSKKSSVPMSETTEGQPKSSTGTAIIHIEGATDHREGRTVIRPDALTHQQWKPVEREPGFAVRTLLLPHSGAESTSQSPEPTRHMQRRLRTRPGPGTHPMDIGRALLLRDLTMSLQCLTGLAAIHLTGAHTENLCTDSGIDQEVNGSAGPLRFPVVHKLVGETHVKTSGDRT
ncbi:MAG: hypothetical protein L6R36_007266 [Xanthoria steineri]|nr:MAG: hypothetical protein L6R36_007266 [Xanthoria steineri]